VREGGIIREGYNQELDSLRNAGRENREWINRYQATEQQRLGISSLKVRYNRVIGFFIEVTKPNIHLVDGKYIKKQTLVNAERFTTQELEEHEALLSEARGRADELEYRLFDELRSRVLEHRGQLYIASSMLAQLDVYCSLAYAARENGYVRPVMTGENRLLVREGRHPVVELVVEEEFIGNDLELDDTERRIMILTGPNMSGKSTYLRQNALIVIMAHLGSFVPAREASIGLVDRVFSRIGASDRLARGESTFLVEMIETARILHYATERSFVIMDEIGRGTSTYDGLAIAWAVLEHLLRNKKVKTLFATHYHEITAMRDSGVVNCNVAVREYNGRVLFLRRVLPGSASRSYGVEVARMAGVPEGVIKRARYLLSTLEMKYGGHVALLGEAAGPAGSDGPGETVGPDTRKPDGPGETVGPDTRKPNEGPGGVSAKQAGSDEESSGPAGQAGTGDESSGAAKQESVDGSGGGQYDLFPSPYEVLIQELRDVDVNAITPLEALNILDRLKKSMSF
jgi:DNA mismatch repair protein MutS